MEGDGGAREDRRRRRTRAALHGALERLIARLDYAAITVSLLAREAGVGRPTFYRHFASVNALLVDRLNDDLVEQRALSARLVRDGVDWYDANVATCRFALERIAAEPRLYRPLLDGSSSTNAVTLFKDQIATLPTVAPFLAAQGDPIAEALGIGTVAGAVSGFLLAWIESGLTPPPAEASAFLIRLLPLGKGRSPGGRNARRSSCPDTGDPAGPPLGNG
ncbi:hypothetical protein ASG29_03550 [Sphingomonas sp. Leaf412]|uniref:TetR/AcrR family transcriptional regulator n=1 Tax=Sphingomonas sp. Leaf412 TaxID=1736370 RepID=UPI0006FA336D|nr:TetR/AcrR family transcriptional regulator [Sphingomonas sp. Leaf412]KQT35200.1 hypothetical protein ASG29_03550 [Sphingomonas sp. Leaf412]